MTSRPFHQHPELCAGVESQEVSRGDVPSHTGGGAKHFCGSRMLKSRGSGSARVGNGRGNAAQNHGEVVEGGSEGSYGSCDFPFFRLSGRLITNGHVRAESVATTVQCSTTYSSTLPMRPVRVDEKDG